MQGLVCSLGDMDVLVYIVALVAMTPDQTGLLSGRDRRALAPSGPFQLLHLSDPSSVGHGLKPLLQKLLV